MNKQNIPAVPDQNKIEELMGKIKPVPSERFHEKMKQASWRTKNLESQVGQVSTHRVRLALTMTILLLLAGLFISPQGRAWAQGVFQFFHRINSETVELPESNAKLIVSLNEDANRSYDLPLVPIFVPTISPAMAALPGCETPQKAQSYGCQVALTESQLGFDLKELSALPEGWKFEFLDFDAAAKVAMFSYSPDLRYNSSGTLQFSQGLGAFPQVYPNNPWEAVPADKIETVRVGNYDGEYVKSSFSGSAGNSLTWSDSYLHRLAWSDGTRWYLIKYYPNPNPPDKMSREQLIRLAESLVDSPQGESEPLDPNALYSTLYSISDAEQISGLDLKAPTLLPLDINFAYAHYYSYTKKVSLFYGINNEMVIDEWKGNPSDFDKLSQSSDPDTEIIKVNGEKGIYSSAQGSYAHISLWWQKDGMNYQIYYYQYFGRIIDKEKLIAIAESMWDIDDFHNKGSVPYNYLPIYEQAMGIDAQEFPETPAGWSFSGIYADVYGPCITLLYKPVATPGWLVINQCSTDKYFNVSDIPVGMIQKVQIGNNEASYAAGSSVIGDNGQLTWNPDLPFQQLYWQEDGLWMQMMISGDSARLHAKEDMISYAESLR
jgi:hypothetical protein